MRVSLPQAALTKKTVLTGIGLAVVMWGVGAAVDALLFRAPSFFRALFAPSPRELVARLLVLCAIAAFAFCIKAITGRARRFEAKLLESERRFGDLLENANDLIQSVAADGSFLYVNRAWRETLGYTEEEAAGLTLVDIIHPDSREHCLDVFRRLMSGEKAPKIEATFVAKDGRAVVVEGNVNTSMVNGLPVSTRGIFRDVTGQRHALEFAKYIMESLDDGFVVIDRDYRIVSANREYVERFAAPQRDVVGRHCFSVVHRLTKPCHEAGEECPVLRVFEGGETAAVEHVHYDKNGNPQHIEVKSLPLRDPHRQVVSAIEIYHDITEKKKLEDQLRHAQKMEAVGTLAGGIAHDFNNILTAIIGYGTLLRMKTADSEPLRSYVDQILMSTERAADLTQGLLAFSRKQPVNLKVLEVNVLVGRMRELVGRLIGEDITVKLDVCGRPLTARADSGQLEQVLMNLVTNARDAMPRGGTLTIRTAVAELDRRFISAHGYGTIGDFAVLSVADTGTGIKQENRGRIFEPFFTTKEPGKGTGLGLAIAYGIIKQHNGYIDVESEEGKGTMVSLFLPLTQASVEQASPEEPETVQGGQATVLVAEDDDGVRRLSRSVLEGVGYTVIEAVDGEDAVRQFTANRDDVDLLFFDIIMPKRNGSEAYAQIREFRPDVKILFASGYPSETLQEKGLLDETMPFISKPVAPRDLLQRVHAVLHDGRKTAPVHGS